MEKFSLYDFLGLLLPGLLLIYFTNIICKVYCFYPKLLITTNAEVNVAIILFFAIIFGAVLYALNFYLVQKKWYNKLFGMYKNIADLYLKMPFLHSIMNETFNKKANEWFSRDIFINKNDFYSLENSNKNEIYYLHDEFYDRMYYELEYHGKNEHSKAFQSFYFFFRQGALACLILLLLMLCLYLLHFISSLKICLPTLGIITSLISLLLFLLIISVQLAKWYRKRMVMKMYWAFFTHLNNLDNGKNID